jgi:hypothetical protein
VRFIDPAPAIARRVAELLGPQPLGPPATPAAGGAEIAFTSGTPPSDQFAAILARFGLAPITR